MDDAQIRTEGDQIILTFSSPLEGARSHSVTIPLSDKGWAAVQQILCDRERSNHQPTIGTRSAPPQYDIDKMMLHIQKIPSVRKVEAPRDIDLEDLGL